MEWLVDYGYIGLFIGAFLAATVIPSAKETSTELSVELQNPSARSVISEADVTTYPCSESTIKPVPVMVSFDCNPIMPTTEYVARTLTTDATVASYSAE